VKVETQKAASERPERPVPTNRDRVQHQVVDAHGVTDIGYTQDQHTRKHEQGVFESKGESGKRTSGKSPVTLGRHVTS